MAIKVKLRQKDISKGRKSLYLDIYPPIINLKTGDPTRREFLKMYVFKKPRNPIDKKHNSETLRIAESIRQQRENHLNKPEIYSPFEKEQLRKKELGEQCFVQYYNKLANKKKSNNHANWAAALKYLKTFTNGSLKFKDLDEKTLEELKDFLLTTNSLRSKDKKLSRNSAVSYFNKIKAALKQAHKDGILHTDLNSKVPSIKAEETRREYLTIEELNLLAKTACKDKVLKTAAIFSAITGMAFKEIQNILWSDISHQNDQGYTILTRRQKTQNDNYLPISNQAYSLTKGSDNPKDMPQNNKVFEGLKYSAYKNKQLQDWIKAAGIDKKISFHNFRHSFATLQLFSGTDIYTVSKMLGHKDLKTTQIYAKVVDESKRYAADKINLDIK